MVRPAAVFRAIARGAGWLIAALGVLLIVWFAANRLLDAPVAPERAAMLAATSDAVPDRRNVAVGILGLTAPKGSDFIEYGVRIKALHTSNASHEQIQEMVRGSKTLRPTVEGGQVTCWVDPEWTSFGGCLPFDRAPAVLEENKELLERYKKLYGLEHYAAVDVYYNDAFLVLTRLAVAEMHLSLRKGDYEAAYRKWYQQLKFIRRNLRATDTWVGKAIGLIAIGMTVPFLDSLLQANPDIARTHRVELYEVLRPGGIASFDPEGIARAELRFLTRALERPPVPVPEYGTDWVHWLAFHFGQKNRILNRYAAFAPEYAASLRLPWADTEKESARLREKHLYPSARDLVLDPFGSLLFAQFVDGQLRAVGMLRQMHFTDRQFRLATLAVHLINENVRDSDIPAFLRSADPMLHDPFSATPPRWDPKDRKIYFVDSTDKCTIASWFRIPDKKRGRKTSSVVDMRAC
jgi:hypothetical protein